METLSFAFGMVAMFTIIVLIVIVVGSVKVGRNQERIENLEEELHNFQIETQEQFNSAHQRIDLTQRDTQEYLTSMERGLDSRHKSETSYVDSRFDTLNLKFERRLEALENKLTNNK